MRIVFLLLLNLVVLTKFDFWNFLSGNQALWDFDVYYHTVKDVMAGKNPYLLPYMQITGPVLMLLPYVPFSLVSLEVGRSLMTLLSLAAVFFTARLLAREFIKAKHWSIGIMELTLGLNLLLLLPFPSRFNFSTGQPNLVIMWLVTMTLLTKEQKVKGILLALMSIIKTNYLIALTTVTKRLGSLLTAGLVLGLVVVVSTVLFRSGNLLDYAQGRGADMAWKAPQAKDADYYNQSVRATMAKFHWGAYYPYVFPGLVVIALIYLMVTGDMISGVIVSLLLSPLLWQHYIVVVYPIVILAWLKQGLRRQTGGWLLLISILLTMHIPSLHKYPATLPYTLYASHYFLGLVMLLIYQGRKIWRLQS